MLPVSVTHTGFTELIAAFGYAPELATDELMTAMIEADALLEREIKELTPEGASGGGAGGLKGSIHSEESVGMDGVIGVVGTSMNYALPVELGTRPHFPPIAPLVDWVIAKLGVREQEAHGVAFAIARKISVSGTPAAGMFHRGLAANEQQVFSIFEAAGERFVQRLDGMGA